MWNGGSGRRGSEGVLVRALSEVYPVGAPRVRGGGGDLRDLTMSGIWGSVEQPTVKSKSTSLIWRSGMGSSVKYRDLYRFQVKILLDVDANITSASSIAIDYTFMSCWRQRTAKSRPP